MKTRLGFVSNSSSSSFVITGESYPTLFDLAVAMVVRRGWEQDDALIKKIKSSTLYHNMPISFSTCNEDTYIVMYEKNFHVKTCHNHDWEGFYDTVDEGSQPGLKGLRHDISSPFDNQDWYDVDHRFEFWYPEYDIIGHEISTGHINCPKCDGTALMKYDSLMKISVPACRKCGERIRCITGRGLYSCCNYETMTPVAELNAEKVLWCSICGKIRTTIGGELIMERLLTPYLNPHL